MSLFQNKKQPHMSPADEARAAVEHLFDDKFREELKDHGRLYFERVINENAALFKQDLDATVAHVNTELKQHMARQLDEQFAALTQANTTLRDHVTKQLDQQFEEYTKTMEHAQDQALEALNRSAQALADQHSQLSAAIEKSVASQDTLLVGAVEESKKQIAAMQAAQSKAVETLALSAQALQEQQAQINAMLEKSVTDTQSVLVNTFEQNMAQIVEHYLLGAIGDQYDMKAQVPSIIKQLEENKQAIVDDMKL
jgi:uncharacterized protein YbjQ (UPF0145 family)